TFFSATFLGAAFFTATCFGAAFLGAGFATALRATFFALTFLGALFAFLATTFLALADAGLRLFATGLAFFNFFAALAGDFLFLAILCILSLVKICKIIAWLVKQKILCKIPSLQCAVFQNLT